MSYRCSKCGAAYLAPQTCDECGAERSMVPTAVAERRKVEDLEKQLAESQAREKRLAHSVNELKEDLAQALKNLTNKGEPCLCDPDTNFICWSHAKINEARDILTSETPETPLDHAKYTVWKECKQMILVILQGGKETHTKDAEESRNGIYRGLDSKSKIHRRFEAMFAEERELAAEYAIEDVQRMENPFSPENI